MYCASFNLQILQVFQIWNCYDKYACVIILGPKSM